MGLAPLLVSEIFRIIKELRTQEITVLLVEQNVQKTLRVADRGYVLHLGKVVHEGASQSLTTDKRIQEAYLGRR
jgi:branched-chain amino acid transport system ATP-binding protein